jgi:hypothetical protein
MAMALAYACQRAVDVSLRLFFDQMRLLFSFQVAMQGWLLYPLSMPTDRSAIT